MAGSLRTLVERPFRKYADFNGRAGRAEYWLFVVLFILLTELAWLLGFGVMHLAGHGQPGEIRDVVTLQLENSQQPVDDDDREHAIITSPATSGEESESDVIFQLHRHHEDEGWHLHGRFNLSEEDFEEWEKGHRPHHWEYEEPSLAERGAEIIEVLVALALLIPLIAVGARRLHDTDKSGWWQFFVFIPVAGWLVLIIFFMMPGDKKKNRFGPPDSP